MPDKYGNGPSAIVVGGGPAGLTAAVALAGAGLATVLVGKRPARPDNRTTALFAGSVTALETLGVWPLCVAQAAPLKIMRIVDDTGRLWRAPEVKFFGRRNRSRRLRLQYRELSSGRGVGATRQRASRAAPGRGRGVERRAGRRRGHGDAQKRRHVERAAADRRRRPPLAVPRCRRHRGRRTRLPAGRAHRLPDAHAAAPRHIDRIPHAERPVHAGAAAGPALESGLGARSGAGRRHCRPRQRRAGGGNRARLPFDPRQDRSRAGARTVSAVGCDCAALRRPSASR